MGTILTDPIVPLLFCFYQWYFLDFKLGWNDVHTLPALIQWIFKILFHDFFHHVVATSDVRVIKLVGSPVQVLLQGFGLIQFVSICSWNSVFLNFHSPQVLFQSHSLLEAALVSPVCVFVWHGKLLFLLKFVWVLDNFIEIRAIKT